jgi:hypothetical protein
MIAGFVFERNLVVKPAGKRPLGKPRCKWKDNIKMWTGFYQARDRVQ